MGKSSSSKGQPELDSGMRDNGTKGYMAPEVQEVNGKDQKLAQTRAATFPAQLFSIALTTLCAALRCSKEYLVVRRHLLPVQRVSGVAPAWPVQGVHMFGICLARGNLCRTVSDKQEPVDHARALGIAPSQTVLVTLLCVRYIVTAQPVTCMLMPLPLLLPPFLPPGSPGRHARSRGGPALAL
jgi:hypothetical protein